MSGTPSAVPSAIVFLVRNPTGLSRNKDETTATSADYGGESTKNGVWYYRKKCGDIESVPACIVDAKLEFR
jgi:hypothetical protein